MDTLFSLLDKGIDNVEALIDTVNNYFLNEWHHGTGNVALNIDVYEPIGVHPVRLDHLP